MSICQVSLVNALIMSHSVSSEKKEPKKNHTENLWKYWFLCRPLSLNSSISSAYIDKEKTPFFFRMLWLFFFGLSTSTLALKNESLQCHDNQWLCGTQCIHQRSFCTLSGTCHPDFPRPCGDGQRCYHRLDNCWNAACLNSDCQKDAKLSESTLDKSQVSNNRTCLASLKRR